MSAQPRWWSGSRKEWQDIATLTPGHPHNALAKVERGDYLPEDGEPLSADDSFLLAQARLDPKAGTPTTGSLGSPVGGTDAAPASQRVVAPLSDIERAQMRKDVTTAVEASEDAVAFLSALSGRPVTSVADLDDDTLRAVASAIKGG